MQTPEFSEFSYGYALVDNIIHGGFGPAVGAPIFPSLKAEGSKGGGYDVKIPLCPVPLFLQLKIPQIVTRGSYLMPSEFFAPYYRMHLRTTPKNQHNMLCELESEGNDVLYATSAFDTEADLNKHYTARKVVDHSAFFSPLDIGWMDDDKHHVAYDTHHDYGWARSTPKKLRLSHKASFWKERLIEKTGKATEKKPEKFLATVLSGVVDAIYENGQYKGDLHRYQSGGADGLGREGKELIITTHARYHSIEKGELSLKRISYLSRTYLGCEFFVLGKTNEHKD